MDRLTQWMGEHAAVVDNHENYIDRLAAYEDTGLEPEEILGLCEMDKRSRMAKMIRWEEAEKQGRLIVLPCKVGDMVYRFQRYFNDATLRSEIKIKPCVIDGTTNDCVITNDHVFMRFSDFGKTVFLSREEAEEALKGESNGLA